ncbi:PREDICTED: thyroid transcription factor 1-associated protein 26-like [Priapulus caudatus]|uniref:Thyroid transcription factor 1-associated protein 26-like n=1 Tax=Priapulus caudatus TaxID=37621 RepID=A0ABM1ED24_PRICU|nr:PREDICTED: thyroid transcription factor 1-associated protein 26-like [Priapulus caudatus]XP_014670094.1 PREDICTED: thyroid transcription factor 1-associated protein 26-like [Priapulus caudatus]XP_014670095.1 PREDICTED: thyroid transcription factor 1-associated protein 26-like [Priapulus caudatus]XP_014670096.1 PREDICTED: thyroid transcription factor 1-associated protein 26-like [Priapulus caudatus]XP_014670097.1 PREDICTED: thyroid transcription factor 1-associated protein 26-like [Priapulus 
MNRNMSDSQFHLSSATNYGKGRVRKMHNKYNQPGQVHSLQDKKTKSVMNQYHKMLRKQKQAELRLGATKQDMEKLAQEEVHTSKKEKRLGTFKKAMVEYENKIEEQRQKKEDAARQKKEKEEALKHYKTKKIERQKHLGKKTKRGQPVLSAQVEHILQKLQSPSSELS